MASLFGNNSERAGSSGPLEQLLGSQKKTEARLAAIEESLAAIKTKVLGSTGDAPALPPPAGAGASFRNSASTRPSAVAREASSSPLPHAGPSPARVSFSPGPESSHSESEDQRLGHLGTLTVHVREARNLIKADLRGLSDPYVVVALPGLDEKRTATIKNNLDPQWDEKVDFDGELRSFLGMSLRLEVFDEDFSIFHIGGRKKEPRPSMAVGESGLNAGQAAAKSNKDDKLGKVAAIPLGFLAASDSKDFDNVPLEGVKSGTISITVTWTATSDDDDQVRALVERDPEVRLLLKEMRKAMEFNAAREEEAKSLGRSRTGTLKRSNSRTNFESESSEGSSFRGGGKGVDGEEKKRGVGGTLNRYFPTLHPDGRFRSVWNIMLAVLITYCGISVPMEICFESDMIVAMCDEGVQTEYSVYECGNYMAWWTCNLIVDLWFILDIMVNFHTGYMQEGHFVNDPRLAAWNYGFSRGFILDCLGSFPLNLVLMAAQSQLERQPSDNDALRVNRLVRILRMTKLFKLTRMVKLIKYMSNFEDFFNPAVLSVVKLVTTMILVSHWFGCMWWLVSEIERTDEMLFSPWYGPENQWMAPEWLVNSPQFSEKYAHAFVWGAGMVTAMVPFDIMPVTVIENWITVMAMFIGLVLNAIVISSLTTALSSMYAKKQLAGKKLDTIRNYLVLKAVPNDLRSRVLEYYEYLFTSSQMLADSIKYEEMPINLATQLSLSINRKLAARCTFFRDVSNSCIVSLIATMQPTIFVPGQLIVFEGQMLLNVYFINRGLVQLFEKAFRVGVLRDNENFGLEDYVAGVEAGTAPVVRRTARAAGYCDVMSLGVDNLREQVESDETFRERHQSKDGRSNTNRFIRCAAARQRINSCMAGLKGRAKTQRIPTNLEASASTDGKKKSSSVLAEAGTLDA